jgi:hypothetical protein
MTCAACWLGHIIEVEASPMIQDTRADAGTPELVAK